MASKQGPVGVVSSDGLPPGLVIISNESVPIELHSQLGRGENLGHSGAAIVNVKQLNEEDNVECDVDFNVDDHAASMVPNLSQMAGPYDVSERVDDATIVQWLQENLIEDDYGKIDCKLMIDLIQKEFGSKKRKTRAWLKRAFPKSYLRRSDRNRWFCGVSLRADEGRSVISIKDKEWMDRAVSWLQSAMEVNPTARERCSDVHHALTQYIGQAAVHMAISAVKMVFPNIPRKTFDRIAFYVGIRFKDPSLGHTPLQSAATTLNSLSDIKTEYSDSAANKLVVAWLQKALIADESSRERIKTICLMIKKEFSRTIPQAKVARLIKKVFPNVIIKLKGSIYGIVWGVQINSECYPVSGWLQKTISWLRKIYEPADPSFCENASPLFDIFAQKFGVERQSQCLTLLQEAFPHIEMKEILNCQMILGIKQKSSLHGVQLPVFTDAEKSQNEDLMNYLDDNSTSEDHNLLDEPSMVYTSIASVPLTSSTPGPQLVSSSKMQMEDSSSFPRPMDASQNQIKEHLKTFSESLQNEMYNINTRFTQIEENVSTIMKDMAHIKDDVDKLIKDNVSSAQQKDSLIIQLQQTLIMLCQHQLQKFMPGEQNLSQQTLNNIIQKGLLNQHQNPDN